MAYGSMTMEERLKEHIKEYSLENLLDLSLVKACFEDISKVLGIELLLTQRHGEIAVEVGNFAGFEPDVVNDPGRKLRVFNRTIGHLYVKMDQASDQELAERIVEHMMLQYEALACDHYRYRETAIYADELEEAMEQEAYRIKRGEHEDALTGLLNKTYMKGRLLEMQETAPEIQKLFSFFQKLPSYSSFPSYSFRQTLCHPQMSVSERKASPEDRVKP